LLWATIAQNSEHSWASAIEGVDAVDIPHRQALAVKGRTLAAACFLAMSA
jgi:hypothetical protein